MHCTTPSHLSELQRTTIDGAKTACKGSVIGEAGKFGEI
jgi:hypothetical protein